jgi:putative transposase
MLDCILTGEEMKKRFSEEQIVKILQECEACGTVATVSRKYNVAEQTIYRWKQVHGGMEVSDVKKLKSLQVENERLKKLVADQALDIVMLKEINTKKF